MAGTKKRRSSARRSEHGPNTAPEAQRPGDVLLRAGDIRASTEKTNSTWRVAENLHDGDLAPHFPLGGETTGRIPVEEAAAVDWSDVMQELPANPILLARRAELELLPDELAKAANAGLPQSAARIDAPGADRQDVPLKKRGAKSTRKRNEGPTQQQQNGEAGS